MPIHNYEPAVSFKRIGLAVFIGVLTK